MKKRYLTVFIIMVAMAFLVGNVYADYDGDKGWKRNKADRQDRKVERVTHKIAKLEEKLARAKQRYEDLTGISMAEPEPQANQAVVPVVNTVGEFTCIGCDFTNSTITNRDFSNANLSASRFYGATLMGVNFTGADLSSVNMLNANLEGIDLSVAATVDGILWSQPSGTNSYGVYIAGGSAVCPDGTNAIDNADGSCEGHLSPQ